MESVADELSLASHVSRVRAHSSTFKSWRLVRSPRGYAVHVAHNRYSSNKESGIHQMPCYTSASENEKRNYQGVLQHYIHLGLPERFEYCSACSVLTVTRHVVASCPDCPEVLEKFIAYLEKAGEQSWSDPDSIVGVSSARL